MCRLPTRARGSPRTRASLGAAVTLVLALLLAAAVALAAVLAVVATRRAARLEAADRAVVALARGMTEEGGSRRQLVEAARQIADAQGAFLAEPDRRGDHLVVTASAGIDLDDLRLPLDAPRPTVRAYDERRPVHVADLAAVPAAAEARRRSGATSVHVRPVRHGDHVVALAREGPLQQGAQVGLVVDDQDLQRRGHGPKGRQMSDWRTDCRSG